MERFYPELKRLAAGQMHGERPEHSWQPTLLVNELYLELIKIKALPSKDRDLNNEKAAFFALAGQIIETSSHPPFAADLEQGSQGSAVGRSEDRRRVRHIGSRGPACPAGCDQAGDSKRGGDEGV